MEKQPSYVIAPLKPDRNLEVPRTKAGGKAATLVIAISGSFIILYFMTHQAIESIFNLNVFITGVIYLLSAIYVCIITVTYFIYDGRRKLLERAYTKGNKQLKKGTYLKLNNTCKDIDFSLDKPVKAALLNYGGTNAVVISIKNLCKEALPKNCDTTHYISKQRLLDLLLNNDYKVDTITMRYQVQNDYLWDYRRQKLRDFAKAYRSKYHEIPEFVNVMSEGFNQQQSYAEKYSNVEVTYLIIQKPSTSVAKYTALLNTLELYGSELNLVNLREFDSAIAKYYGFKSYHTDAQEIMYAGKLVKPGLIHYIGYIDENNQFIQLTEDNKINFNTSFEVTEPKIKTGNKNKTVNLEKSITSIFEDEFC